MTAYLLERAWLPGPEGRQWRDEVLVEVADGRFTRVDPDCPAALAERVPGLTVPGFANAHSHVFHRALRGRTQHERGSFWTWRDQMYAVAARLDPDTLFALALATYREMAAAGFTSVGEFHYLHHQPDGTAYGDPNALGLAVIAAARQAGLRIALLDTCYLSSGFGAAPHGVQRRYSDGAAAHWVERRAALEETDGVVVGAAIHSVRAVPAEQLATVVEAAAGRPLHVHLSEQVAENDACLAAYGRTPTQLLADNGALGPTTTAVHATHLTREDITLLGQAPAFACFCPTTERDLGDGIGPSRLLHGAGVRLTLGSDSQAVIDPFEEMRAVELDERLATRTRGHWSAAELMTAATVTGQASLGFSDAGRIEVGARADLVSLDPSSPRTAGTGRDEGTVVFAASAADVTRVMIDGRPVVGQGEREQIGRELDRAVRAVIEEVEA